MRRRYADDVMADMSEGFCRHEDGLHPGLRARPRTGGQAKGTDNFLIGARTTFFLGLRELLTRATDKSAVSKCWHSSFCKHVRVSTAAVTELHVTTNICKKRLNPNILHDVIVPYDAIRTAFLFMPA